MTTEEKQVPVVGKTSPTRSLSFDEKYHAHDIDDGSSIIEGSEDVTYYEYRTLRRVADRLPVSAWLVVFVEFAERWTYHGTTNLYSNYIRAPLPRGSKDGSVLPADRAVGIAGALGKGQQKSFAIRTFNNFWSFFTPFIGGIVADTWLGRYTTIMVFAVICLVGHIILVASATPMVLEQVNTSLGLLILSIVIMGLGAGGIKANVPPMIAEQYQGKLRKETLPSGEVIIKDPNLTFESVYMWFYAAVNWGACGAISSAFLSRDHGYWAAYLVPTCLFVLVPVVLVIGKKYYIITPPRGSILLETCRVVAIALAPAWHLNPVKTIRAVRAPGFWAPAKPSSYPDGQVPPRITWDDEFVGEVARTLNACAVFLFLPLYLLCYSQIDGNLSTVAAGMTLHGTPNDLIRNWNPIAMVIIIPIFDYGLYPFLRRVGINFSPIKRIYAGFIASALAMVYSAVLQHYLYKTSPCHDGEPSACTTADDLPNPSPISVWVVVGPYILVALAEIFASITALEYAFTKAPARMRGVAMAVPQAQSAIASALNFALVAVNVEPKFEWLFASLAIATWIAGTIFFFIFRGLDKKEVQLNSIGKGDRKGFIDEQPELVKDDDDKA